jgi:hypothetical protein
MIGIQAGRAKLAYLQMFTGQSLVKDQVMNETAVVVPVNPKIKPAV